LEQLRNKVELGMRPMILALTREDEGALKVRLSTDVEREIVIK
jgi:hypothetical protein